MNTCSHSEKFKKKTGPGHCQRRQQHQVVYPSLGALITFLPTVGQLESVGVSAVRAKSYPQPSTVTDYASIKAWCTLGPTGCFLNSKQFFFVYLSTITASSLIVTGQAVEELLAEHDLMTERLHTPRHTHTRWIKYTGYTLPQSPFKTGS